jgi:hypothetical protein
VKESAVIVHLPHKQVKFTKGKGKLYYYKPNFDTGMRNKISMIETVEENKLPYTEHQFQRAKKAQELYHALGTPSLKDFKAIIQTNAIRNNPITLEDIKIAESIFGLDIGGLKGKSVRTKPTPVVSDYIAIPQEIIEAQKDVTLCMDTLDINGLKFFATVS